MDYLRKIEALGPCADIRKQVKRNFDGVLDTIIVSSKSLTPRRLRSCALMQIYMGAQIPVARSITHDVSIALTRLTFPSSA